MFKKILIANRGEIAIRIMRACREMGIEYVAVYSTADAASLHVQFAGETYCIGGPKVQDSYINMKNILSVALAAKCDAIHPGFGFLAENSEFAKLCREYGITFIGPEPEVIELMGDKIKARQLMLASDVPVVPGSPGLVDTVAEAQSIAREIGYPILVKAAAGGGGRGMRKVFAATELERNFLTAKAEAEACFGNGDMYIEKLIESPKHIEFQLLGDKEGNIIHLGERDCSIQRRNQKVMEETPSPRLSDDLRQKMGEAAVKAGKAANYQSAGTVEFVLDKDGNYYFIEMNTRIQVEHPITELITGIDIVKEQIRIAVGLPLGRSQEDITFKGCAIECRINGEKPQADFQPSVGKIDFLH
ncbi:MAG: biotin carboxylase N-terminal domain-containing protein, partial [Bacillota bacterium]|nr:biotin carboxylase N-terminal domain-containing protein [Bacillota bacterium]